MNGHFYDFVLRPLEALSLRGLRSHLIKHAHGKTLEVGIGTGLNLKYYPKDVQLIAIEPDESMRRMAKKRASHHHVQIKDGDAESLDFESSTFDTVVATLVFCSINNPDRAIEEVYRVLKPGGKFLLLEHVRRNTPIAGRLLDLLTPLWKHAAGGCHLNRDPSKHLQDVGFKIDSAKTLWGGLGKIWHLRK
ncbi:MAG: class I SAM-dependent methyltransferase [Bacteriovorax sp.]